MNEKYKNIEAYLVGLKKKIGLEKQLLKIHTLVLGSSHGQYSFVPQEGEYNLCLPSQDLYYSYSLYKKYHKKLKNLRNIVLYYSVFSRGYELVKTNEDYRCYHYEKIFGIKPSHKCYKERLYQKYACYDEYIDAKTQNIKLPKNYRGENPDTKGKNVGRIGITDPVLRANSAYKHYNRRIIQDKYILKTLNIARKNNHNLILIISPAHKEYKKAIPPAKEIFENIFLLKKQYMDEITLLDFYQRDDFVDSEWWDYDHLNPMGAKKFTKIYHSLIKQEN